MYNGKKIQLIDIWECEFDRMCREDVELKKFLNDFDMKLPLNVRESFFGGRVEPIRLHHKCKENEKIKYYDITSLYPFVQKYRKYPIGHPQVIINNFKDINEYFGFVKLSIIPPKNLYIPLLPLKANGKLLFALCQTCANLNLNKCNHNDNERAILGTFCTEEIKEAIKNGYKVQKIYEIWHFEQSSSDLFKVYIDKFLKGKQMASGFPENVKTDDQKVDYILDYFNNEGIWLDKDNIKYNSGMRALMKLLLNSFWGKFGQADNKIQYKVITDTAEWISLITNEQFIVHRADFTNNKYLQVYFKHKSEINETMSKTNVCLASFVTCYGRLKLYEELNKLKDRVLYCDTDSIIFISKENAYEPELGNYLGEFTNEIDLKKGNFIKEFVSLAPKSYAYLTDTGFSHALCKGIAFNHITKLHINLDTMKEIVLDNNNKELDVDQLQFIRNKSNWTMKTQVQTKKLKFTFDKRIILENNYETIPYGYINQI